MKILKFFSLGSLLIIAINFGLALYSSMNGNYNVGYVHRMVSFIFYIRHIHNLVADCFCV